MWSSGSILANRRYCPRIGVVGNRVLVRRVNPVFVDLGGNIVSLVLEVGVVVNNLDLRLWLSQLRWVRQAHGNLTVNRIAVNIGLAVNHLITFDPVLVSRLLVGNDLWRWR